MVTFSKQSQLYDLGSGIIQWGNKYCRLGFNYGI